ncbi:hypothetical protein BDV96DRAFT_574886 [Lophiotrema nucula]|uniref:Uncharacterized protein n=1 Tax=Lophiotrema nucula TaxID=690887 RepID=A0A6A5ZB94_9PLEO|nr:hypothetical protein BDV96DRAFT_574886 [Lophiotrema nucula]
MNTLELNEEYSSRRNSAYLKYASQCYRTTSDSQSETCRPYVKPKLPYTLTTNATCPLDDEMCLVNSGNIVMDSGFLDGQRDFG